MQLLSWEQFSVPSALTTVLLQEGLAYVDKAN